MATTRTTITTRRHLPRIIRRGRLVVLVAVLALMHGAGAEEAAAVTPAAPAAILVVTARPDTALRTASAPESLGAVEASR